MTPWNNLLTGGYCHVSPFVSNAVAVAICSILLSESCWFDSPGLHAEVSLAKSLDEPQTAPDMLVSTFHGSHRHQCMNVWTKASAKCPKCKCHATDGQMMVDK